MLRVRSSRRAASLKPTDYDHEIVLLDHDGAPARRRPDGEDMSRVSTESRLLPSVGEETDDQVSRQPSRSETAEETRIQERPEEELQHEQELPPPLRTSIEIQAPTPEAFFDAPQVKPKKPEVQRETAIDILYENERGGWLCGRPLFAAAALGGLDPTPWTNAFHKPSPTSIHTAQVPDPTWEWVWSSWHVNQQEGLDEGGWEYSFAFSNKFSWHPARWYNSFVRRRAWTRKRAKKRPEDISADPHMENGDYFLVKPASSRRSARSHRSQSLSSSRVPSKSSLGKETTVEMAEVKPDIEDIETLLETLRFARIDREKLEATENYLENAMDLSRLRDEMHEIMSIFIFQASRRLLLSHLMAIYDDNNTELEKKPDDVDLKDRKKALQAALAHADEEVRKLAYWSDVKRMAERGESKGAVDGDKGWCEDWEGVDQSGPEPPNLGKLPSP